MLIQVAQQSFLDQFKQFVRDGGDFTARVLQPELDRVLISCRAQQRVSAFDMKSYTFVTVGGINIAMLEKVCSCHFLGCYRVIRCLLGVHLRGLFEGINVAKVHLFELLG